MTSRLFLQLLPLLGVVSAEPEIPFLNLFSERGIGDLTRMATRLAAAAAQSTVDNERDVVLRPGRPEVREISLNARPSEIFGQSLTNVVEPTKAKLFQPRMTKTSEEAPFLNSPFMQLANSFLKGAAPEYESEAPPRSLGTRIAKADGPLGAFVEPSKVPAGDVDPLPIPRIKDVAPLAEQNFGIPRGDGCLPFLGEFMQMAYGNCVRDADEKTWDTWGSEINKVFVGGKLDLLGASKETCKRGAEREQCGQLRRAISHCDIIASLTVATQLQRAIQRCDEVTGIVDQNPMTMMRQVNSLISGEFAQGFLNKFLG